MTMFIEKIVGDLGDKRRWRQYKARVKALPASHRTMVEALEWYPTYSGVITRIEHGINKERGRLVKAIECAEGEAGGTRS